MITSAGHLTYCSNIHPGESWDAHFEELKASVPFIREKTAPGVSFGLGLRLANQASLELSKPHRLEEFKAWLAEQDAYVFTMNGFPYGGFHGAKVKDQVHAPDWTTEERLSYTRRLFEILTQLLPEGMQGSISTPPLSYKYWWNDLLALEDAKQKATQNILAVVETLIVIGEQTGKIMHLDIEPEPDGILDNGKDFIAWYTDYLLPEGIRHLRDKLGWDEHRSTEAILLHVQLCYDVCHVAVSYEEGAELLQELEIHGIRIGKIQISSALQIDFDDHLEEKIAAIGVFNEPVYLHQVVARLRDGNLLHYRDLPDALEAYSSAHKEWRVHFHVPLFIDTYGWLNSTRKEISKILALHQQKPVTQYLEIETYTWGVLPDDMQKPIAESIAREISWVQDQLR